MKILMIAPYPVPGASIKGGVETVTHNLVEGFKQIPGVNLLVIVPCVADSKEIKISDNVTVRYLQKLYSVKKIEFPLHVRREILKIDKEFHPDIIHIQGNGTNLSVYHPSIAHKLVITQHGIIDREMNCAKSLRKKFNYWLAMQIERHFRKRFHNWVIISRYNEKVLGSFLNKGIRHRLIYNSVNPAYFEKNHIEDDTKQTVNLLYVGVISPLKALQDLVVAISKCEKPQKFHLDVVGGYDFLLEPYVNDTKSIIKSKGLDDVVSWHGWKSPREIIKIMEHIDALVVPSHQENLPCVIAESMAMGKIIVASAVGGVPEMVEEGVNGYMFAPGDTDRLARILDSLSEIPHTEKKRMSQLAVEKASRLYDPRAVALRHIDFYKEIIDRNKRGNA